MKIIFSVFLLMGLLQTAYAQHESGKIAKKIADKIVSENNNALKVVETGELITDFNNIPHHVKLQVASPYKHWEYWNGLLNIAMLEFYEFYKDDKYKKFSVGNYQFLYNNMKLLKSLNDNKRLSGLENYWNIVYMDHCGPMGAGLLEVYKYDSKKEYNEYFDRASTYLTTKQTTLADGTYALDFPYNKTTWADNLYMSLSFIARMGQLTGDKKYYDLAAKQIINFDKYLWNQTTQLYAHCWYDDIKEQGVAHWGRANGWVALSAVTVLQVLPKNHPKRAAVLAIYRKQMKGIIKYQSEFGLWHQLLDKNDSFLETSATAMFTYALAKGVNKGWIEERYKTVAFAGWKGIESKVNSIGEVDGICVGTGTSTSLTYYYDRPTLLNDIHGLGAVLLAGIEVTKLPKDSSFLGSNDCLKKEDLGIERKKMNQ